MLTLVRNRHRRLQQIHHALDRSHRALVEVSHFSQARQRPEQALCQINQHRITADADLAIQGHEAAVQQRDREPGEYRHADHRRDRGRPADCLAVARAVGIRTFADAFGLELLGGVGLHCRNPTEIIVQARRQRPRRFTHRRIARGKS